MGRAFNKMVCSLTDIPFRDTQCGFKAFRTPLARVLFHLMRAQRFAFDVEVLSLARLLRMEIAEVAVHWRDVGESSVRMLTDPISMTRDVLMVRTRRQWPDLPGLVVEPAPGERRRSQSRMVAELHTALGPNFPIIARSEDETAVLLPLCDPIEVQGVAEDLRRLPTRLFVRERSFPFSELLEHAPFEWLDGPEEGLVVASGNDPCPLVVQPPPHGWDSMRSNGHAPAVGRVHA
jgi:hypothetical protein